MPDFHLDPAVDNYCVMGNPVAHSLSPRIHALFAKQTGESLLYQAILVEENSFATALSEFRGQGGNGVNITVPFKEDAFNAADTLTQRAERAHAVNTIHILEDGTFAGHNTDGTGLVRDLTVNHDCVIRNRKVLILGAGGAASGVIDPIMDESPAQIIITNRTVEKAEALARRFSDRGEIVGCGYSDLVGQTFPVVINATSASLKGEVPPLPDNVLSDDACCYDMMYAKEDTAFVAWARERGAKKAVDGMGMLIEQAAESFYIWRGVRPETASIIVSVINDIKQGR